RSDFEIDCLRRCFLLKSMLLIPAYAVSIDIRDQGRAEHRHQVLQIGLLNGVASLRQDRLLDCQPLLSGYLKQARCGAFLQSVIAFFKLPPPFRLCPTRDLDGARLCRLADFLALKVELVPPSLLTWISK